MTTPTPPLPNLLRAAADWLAPGCALQEHLRAAADRLEAEQPAPDSGELQRLRDENAKLRVDTIMPMQAEIDLWRDRAEWLLGEMRKEADRG